MIEHRGDLPAPDHSAVSPTRSSTFSPSNMPPTKRKAVDDGKSTAAPAGSTRSLRPRVSHSAKTSDPGKSENAMSSKPKRTPARSAKKDPWSEEYLTTNPKSALVHADLVKVFANPKAWTCLDESEKKEILALLPDHIHPNPDPDPDDPEAKIPPLPQHFLRYDNNWRYGVRQFQADLDSGRYDPEWLRQAQQARKDRAEGKFDKFKEEEFEQFWGQKQKLDTRVIAGESSKVKLDTLIRHAVVKVGDVWKYSRVFNRINKTEKILIEKEAKILAIDDSVVTFAVPAGQRIFLSNTHDIIPENGISTKDLSSESVSKNGTEISSKSEIEINADTTQALTPSTEVNWLDKEAQTLVDRDGDSDRITGLEPKPENGDGDKIAPQECVPETSTNTSIPEEKPEVKKRGRGRPRKRKAADLAGPEVMVEVAGPSSEVPPSSPTPALPAVTDAVSHPQEKDDVQLVEDNHPEPQDEHSTTPGGMASATAASSDAAASTAAATTAVAPQRQEEDEQVQSDIVIPNVAGPSALINKILQIDGRIKDPPNGNAWKELRCYRNNQDMGSLWELRQAWFLREKK